MIDLIELRVLALVGLITVMIGTTLLVSVGVAVAGRLRPIWERMRGRPVRKAVYFDADNGDGDSPGRRRIPRNLSAIRITGGEIQ